MVERHRAYVYFLSRDGDAMWTKGTRPPVDVVTCYFSGTGGGSVEDFVLWRKVTLSTR